MHRYSLTARHVALLLATFTLVAGCNSGSEKSASTSKRIILLINTNSPYWDTARAGMELATTELHLKEAGITATMEVNDGTPEGQISRLRQFANESDIIGLAVSPINASNAAIADELRNLRAKGVNIICADGDLDREKFRDARAYYVGTNNYVGGQVLGTAAKNLRPEGGEYVQFVGFTNAQNAIDRMNGFSESVGDKFIERGRKEDKTDKTVARQNVRDALTNFPKLAMLVGIWSYNAPAIVDVVKEQNRPDVGVVTFDAEKLAIDDLGQGQIQAMVVQNPFKIGYDLVRLLKAMSEKDQKTIQGMFPHTDQKDGDLYDTGLRVVVPDEKSPLKKEMFGDRAEFYTLPEFRKWLAERKLESS